MQISHNMFYNLHISHDMFYNFVHNFIMSDFLDSMMKVRIFNVFTTVTTAVGPYE